MAAKRKRRSRTHGRSSSRTRARRPSRARDRDDRNREPLLRHLDQRHLDLAGLVLIAVGAYLGFVIYGGWDGGPAGDWTESAFENAVGRLAGLMPLAMASAGAVLVMRPFMRSPGAVWAGGGLVIFGLLLAYAAQTAGLGPERPLRHGEFFEPRFFSAHGGAIGEVLYWSAASAFQRIGAHILAVLLIVSGAIHLSGRTVSELTGPIGAAFGRARRGAGEIVRTRKMSVTELVGGFSDPDGADIAVTRAGETEQLDATPLGNGAEAFADGAEPIEEPGWEADEQETGDFAYDSELGAPESEAADANADPEQPNAAELTPMGEPRGVTASAEIDYRPPASKVLDRSKADPGPDKGDRAATGKALLESLHHFGVDAKLVGTVSGPHVSRYELQLAPGTKVGKVAQLSDDLAYALASTDIRILAPIPGKKAVGVEVPNNRRRIVRLGDVYDGRPQGASPLVAWMGRDVSGQSISADIGLMPHLLVAGTTGSGKSGAINSMLCSVLMHASPNDVRLVLVDPKRVELNHYEKLPHLITPVVTNPRLAANVLANLIGEMENRYEVMGEARARNLVELNRVRVRAGEPPLPHVLCVIDELADLMMVAPAEVEDSIIRLAQKSRAVGIHLVLATQRPSTDVITGTIKVNIPARIAFSVASQVDSRVILDQGGAETLLGQGDMLFRPVGTSKLQRIQGAFVTEDEIARICKHWASQGEPEFADELLESREEPEGIRAGDDDLDPDKDDLLADAAAVVVEGGTASVSMIQRRLRVGYTRAGRLIDMLERRGVISGYEGSKPRQVLVSAAELPRILGGPDREPVPATEPAEAG